MLQECNAKCVIPEMLEKTLDVQIDPTLTPVQQI